MSPRIGVGWGWGSEGCSAAPGPLPPAPNLGHRTDSSCGIRDLKRGERVLGGFRGGKPGNRWGRPGGGAICRHEVGSRGGRHVGAGARCCTPGGRHGLTTHRQLAHGPCTHDVDQWLNYSCVSRIRTTTGLARPATPRPGPRPRQRGEPGTGWSDAASRATRSGARWGNRAARGSRRSSLGQISPVPWALRPFCPQGHPRGLRSAGRALPLILPEP